MGVSENSVSVVELLLKYGAELDTKDRRGFTPLVLAAVCNKTEMMRLLLASGADCEARDNEGHNALWWAQNVGSTEAADILRGPPWNSVEGSMTHEEQTAHVLKTRELLGRIGSSTYSHPSYADFLLSSST